MPIQLSAPLQPSPLLGGAQLNKFAMLSALLDYMQTSSRLQGANIYQLIRPHGFGLTAATRALEQIIEAKHATLDKAEQLEVLRISFNAGTFNSIHDFRDDLCAQLQRKLWDYHVNKEPSSYQSPHSYLSCLLNDVSHAGAHPLAVIIDNYEAPFLSALSLKFSERAEAISLYLTALNAIKQAGHSVAFCLLTGHIKLALSSLYAEGLPVVRDISVHPTCDTLLGFTPADFNRAFATQLKRCAPRQGLTSSELCEALVNCYGGYVFSDRNIPLLCPSSVIAALNNEGRLLTYQEQFDYAWLMRLLQDEEPDLAWLFDKGGQDPLHLESVNLLNPGRRDIGVLLVQLGFATINRITVNEGDDYINWRYRFSAPNEEMRRLLYVLEGKASVQLCHAPINPRVLDAGFHDFDVQA